MNILIPLAGTTALDDGQIVPLVDVNNKTLLEYVISNVPYQDEANYVFVVQKEDCDKHHLDAVIQLLCPGAAIVRTPGPTQGQLCSCLMGIEHIENDQPLLIVNGNQFLFEAIEPVLGRFIARGVDGGVITFPNVHPRWSYVRLDADGETVVETSEKRPISKHACAGIFYYRRGRHFVEAAKDVIRKRTMVGDQYYVSSTYNSMILSNKRIVAHEVPAEAFCSLHTPRGVENFIAALQDRAA